MEKSPGQGKKSLSRPKFVEKDLPIVNKILKQLTPERVKEELEEVQKTELPPELQRWVREYNKVGSRENFTFSWLYRIIQIVTLPITAKKYRRSLWETKFLMATFIILLDDVADKTQQERLLNELLKIPFRHANIQVDELNQEEKKYLTTATRLWNYIGREVKKYPRYEELEGIFNFDVAQLLNTMRYAYLVNKNPFFTNKTEYWLYSSHSEESMICFTLDLMCSPNLDMQKFSIVRELGWEAQKMTRIGDCLSTWVREMKERDITSGVFAYALSSGVVTFDDLTKREPSEVIKKIEDSRVEQLLFEEWERAYRKFNKLARKHRELNVKEVLLIPQKLIIAHLSSRGYY